MEIIELCQRQDLETALSQTNPGAIAWDLTNAQSGDWTPVRRLRHYPALNQAPFILYGQPVHPPADAQQVTPDNKQPEASLASLGMTGFVVKSSKVPVIIFSNKMLSLEDVKRIEIHTHVTLQTKGIWSETETISALNRVIFGTDRLPAHTSALVKQAIAYLHQNFARSLSRWEIAEAVGVSEDYLSRVFHKLVGLSPQEFRENSRR